MASKQVKESKATFTDWMALAVLLAVLAGIGFGAGYRVLTSPSTEPKPVTLETRVTCLENGHVWEFQGVTYVVSASDTTPVWDFHCLRCEKDTCHGESTMTDKLWKIVERKSGLKRPQEKPVASGIVTAKACNPNCHQWSCVSFDNDPYLDAWDVWTFKCSKCNLTYSRGRDVLHQAELDLIEKWCGVRPEKGPMVDIEPSVSTSTRKFIPANGESIPLGDCVIGDIETD